MCTHGSSRRASGPHTSVNFRPHFFLATDATSSSSRFPLSSPSTTHAHQIRHCNKVLPKVIGSRWLVGVGARGGLSRRRFVRQTPLPLRFLPCAAGTKLRLPGLPGLPTSIRGESVDGRCWQSSFHTAFTRPATGSESGQGNRPSPGVICRLIQTTLKAGVVHLYITQNTALTCFARPPTVSGTCNAKAPLLAPRAHATVPTLRTAEELAMLVEAAAHGDVVTTMTNPSDSNFVHGGECMRARRQLGFLDGGSLLLLLLESHCCQRGRKGAASDAC